MIGTAIGAGLKSAAEIGQRERRDLLRDSEFDRRIVERGDGGIELGEQVLLRVQLIAVRIESSEGTEENLALESERGARLNDLGHLLELAANACRGELGLQGRKPLSAEASTALCSSDCDHQSAES